MFTPLLSPAVPPIGQAYIPDFAKPDPFSPLTSPALDAYHHRTHMMNPHMNPAPGIRGLLQNQHQQLPNHNRLQNGSEQLTQSPVLNKNSSGRRKSISSRAPSRVVLESPSMKPQRKRILPSLSLPKVATALEQHARTVPPTPRNSGLAGSQTTTPVQYPSHDVSSNDSVSPEPLPEVLMAPPPPRKTTPLTSLAEQPRQNAPVTPASLMNLAKTSLPTDDIPPVNMDTSEFLNRDISIGESQSARSPGKDEQATPTMNSDRRTPSLTPSLKPKHSKSPKLAPTPAAKSRKRGSVSSSPALQPRISPSMKPLLPLGSYPPLLPFPHTTNLTRHDTRRLHLLHRDRKSVV